jgi:hypothetical protein
LPSSGFFNLYIGHINAKTGSGDWTGQIPFGITDADLIANLQPPYINGMGIINSASYPVGSFSFLASSFGNDWYLDGSSIPISFAGLPAGFTLTSCFLNINAFASFLGNPGEDVSAHAYWDGSSGLSVDLPSSGLLENVNYDIFTNHPNVTSIDLEAASFGIISNNVTISLGGYLNLGIIYIYISGTYEISQSKFTLDTTTPVYIGDKVKFTSNFIGPGAGFVGKVGILDGVKQIQLVYQINGTPQTITISSEYMIIQQSDMLWFYLPNDLGTFTGDVKVVFVGDGVQFSGSVMAGILQVLYEDASGIYKLAKGQTNDILYFRSGYTTDLNILMLSGIREDDVYYDNDDFFSMLKYSYKVLAQDDLDLDENYETEDFNLSTTLRQIISPISVEIPSPFIRTAFLP